MNVLTLFFGTILLGSIKEIYRLFNALENYSHEQTVLHLHQRKTIRCLLYGFYGQTIFTTAFVFINTITRLHNYPLICQLEGFTALFVFFLVFYHFVDLLVYEEDTTPSYFSSMVRIVPCWAASFMWAVLPLFGFGFYIEYGKGTFCSVDWKNRDRFIKIYLWGLIFGFIVPFFYVIQAFRNFSNKKERLTSKTLHWIPKSNLFQILFYFVLFWSPFCFLQMITLIGYNINLNEFANVSAMVVANMSYILVPRMLANSLKMAVKCQINLMHYA